MFCCAMRLSPCCPVAEQAACPCGHAATLYWNVALPEELLYGGEKVMDGALLDTPTKASAELKQLPVTSMLPDVPAIAILLFSDGQGPDQGNLASTRSAFNGWKVGDNVTRASYCPCSVISQPSLVSAIPTTLTGPGLTLISGK